MGARLQQPPGLIALPNPHAWAWASPTPPLAGGRQPLLPRLRVVTDVRLQPQQPHASHPGECVRRSGGRTQPPPPPPHPPPTAVAAACARLRAGPLPLPPQPPPPARHAGHCDGAARHGAAADPGTWGRVRGLGGKWAQHRPCPRADSPAPHPGCCLPNLPFQVPLADVAKASKGGCGGRGAGAGVGVGGAARLGQHPPLTLKPLLWWCCALRRGRGSGRPAAPPAQGRRLVRARADEGLRVSGGCLDCPAPLSLGRGAQGARALPAAADLALEARLYDVCTCPRNKRAPALLCCCCTCLQERRAKVPQGTGSRAGQPHSPR